ncbi:MAG: hypothetical protein LBS22_02225 [Puniceicoccales bacterium]|jgi:hypothetical protein|nr:hypothetical protein [Puniceicoccales bacterium]
MRRVERTPSVHSYGQLGAKPLEKASTAAKVGDSVVVGDKAVSIPPRQVPEDVLAARSVATAVSRVVARRNPRIDSVSLLDITAEKAANLTEDEIVELLRFKGRTDPSKLALVLFLPDGYRIAIQLVKGISEDRWLELLGGDQAAADDFGFYMLFGEKFLWRAMEERPTLEEAKEYIRVECELSPEDLQNEEVDGRVTPLAQAMVDVYANKSRRRKFGDQLQKITHYLLNQLPSPDSANRGYWRTLCKVIKDEMRSRSGGKKLIELGKDFPALKAALEIPS